MILLVQLVTANAKKPQLDSYMLMNSPLIHDQNTMRKYKIQKWK